MPNNQPLPVKGVAFDVLMWFYNVTSGSVIPNPGGLSARIVNDANPSGIATTNDPVVADPVSGMCRLTLTAAEMDSDSVGVVASTSDAGAVPFPCAIYPITVPGISAIVQYPMTSSGDLVIWAGDDYEADLGRAVIVDIADASHLLGADSGTVVLVTEQSTWTATAVTVTLAGYRVTFEPTAAQTVLLTQTQRYDVKVHCPDGDVVTVHTGTMQVTVDLPG